MRKKYKLIDRNLIRHFGKNIDDVPVLSKEDIVGGFDSALYWSSSEINFNAVSHQDFTNGFQGSANKGGDLRVRAIRAF